jgi:hypothetical protein
MGTMGGKFEAVHLVMSDKNIQLTELQGKVIYSAMITQTNNTQANCHCPPSMALLLSMEIYLMLLENNSNGIPLISHCLYSVVVASVKEYSSFCAADMHV